MNLLSTITKSAFSSFGGSATIASAQVPERATYEREVSQEAVRQSRTFNPHGQTRFQNMGYWTDGTRTYDEAAIALTRVVAEAANFSEGDRILDVGCGFGDQDFVWIEDHSPQRLVAVDIDPAHIEVARETAKDRDLLDQVEFRVASAVDLSSFEETFDKVVSLEAAHEFMTREAFFSEAYRVLSPGGRLVTTDILPLPGRKVQHFTINPANNYSRIVYAEKLWQAGFVNVKILSLRELVLKPFEKYMGTLAHGRGLAGKWRMFKRHRLNSQVDYVLAIADKPVTSAIPEMRCPMGSF